MDRRAIIALVLIIIGSLFLLDNLNILEFPRNLFTWPSILIVVAAINLFNRNYRGAIIFFSIGSYFLLDRYYNLHLEDWWPLFLIAFGLLVLFRNKSKKIHQAIEKNFFDELTIFGATEKRIVNQLLEGGKSTTVFGGTDIDLSESQFARNATIDVITIFGGTDLKLPTQINARINVISILGGFDDKRKEVVNEKSPQITIKGFTVFGATEIKD